MKILAITQSKDILGGANRSFLDVLESLKNKYGHEIFVLIPGEGDFLKEIEKLGIKYKVCNYKQTSSMKYGNWKTFASYLILLYECFFNKYSARIIAKDLIKFNFDVVYINDTTNSIGYYISNKLEIPSVWHFRGYNEKINRYMTIADEIKLRKNKNCTFINISNAMKNHMIKSRKLKEKNMVVIYNGVSNNCLKNYEEWGTDILQKGLHCLQCGHLSDAKGQVDAVKALFELKTKGYNNIYLHFAGTPSISHGVSYDMILKKLATEYNVIDHVIFEGEIEKMGDFRKNMDIELMCSKAEPFGRVTVEGMQSGLVVIGANTGATPEIIRDKYTGLIYEQGNAKSLANCIEKVYLDRKLGDLLAKNGFEYTKTHFTMENNVEEINKTLIEAKRSKNEFN